MNKKGALLLAGAAAYAYYRYTKMTPEEKENLKSKINETAQKVLDNIPQDLKGVFNKAADEAKNAANSEFRGEHV